METMTLMQNGFVVLAALVGFLAGKSIYASYAEDIIADTIVALIEQGIIKAEKDGAGEYKIFRHDEEIT